MSWNRKYRPTKAADINLEHVREQVGHFLRQGRIPQTLLFAGPKGTGKTSTSRIIGAILNDPSNHDAVKSVFFEKNNSKKVVFRDVETKSAMIQKILEGNSFVVQEMDAASNRGIDDIRYLKERIMLPPQEGMMAVYILDEAHMLTNEAFNALLKILEEPPPHVVFILATTELHKIPTTIISRCHVINFRKATKSELKNAIKRVLDAEKITANQSIIDSIVARSDGSFRDAIKLTEMSVENGSLSEEKSQSSVYNALDSELELLVKNTISKNPQAVVLQFEQFRSQQLDPIFIHKKLLELLHQQLLLSFENNPDLAFISPEVAQYLLQQLSDPDLSDLSPLPHLPLELKLLGIIQKAQKNNGSNGNKLPKPSDNTATTKSEAQTKKTTSSKKDPDSEKSQKSKTVPEAIVLPKLVNKKSNTTDNKKTSVSSSPESAQEVIDNWPSLVDKMKESNSSIALLLQSAEVAYNPTGKIIVEVFYAFHQEQLNQPEILATLSKVSQNLFDVECQFEIRLGEKIENSTITPQLAVEALM